MACSMTTFSPPSGGGEGVGDGGEGVGDGAGGGDGDAEGGGDGVGDGGGDGAGDGAGGGNGIGDGAGPTAPYTSTSPRNIHDGERCLDCLTVTNHPRSGVSHITSKGPSPFATTSLPHIALSSITPGSIPTYTVKAPSILPKLPEPGDTTTFVTRVLRGTITPIQPPSAERD